MRHIMTYKYVMISGSHYYSIQGPNMPKKLKKSTAEKEEVTLEEIVTITHLRKQKAERDMLHERRMERDLTRLLRSWHKDKLPKSVDFGFSASYMINFIFACCSTPEEANHLLISTIAKQLVISNEIEHSETMIQ